MGEKIEKVNVVMTEEMYGKLRALAYAQRTSMAEQFRRAAEFYLSANQVSVEVKGVTDGNCQKSQTTGLVLDEQ